MAANHLEQYLNDIYNKEITIKLEKEETEFIRTSVEESMDKVTELIRHRQQSEIQTSIDGFCRKYPGLKLVDNLEQDCPHLLKVGSFYDGTKNSMPDQFNFVLVIGTFLLVDDSTSFRLSANDQLLILNKEILGMIRQLSLDYLTPSFSSEFGNICFMYAVLEKPALTLRFKQTYTQIYTKTRYINVDLVPAFKIIDPEIRKRVTRISNCQGFCEEIKGTGSFLVVDDISFTETEVNFVKDRLSDRHRKVFRLVKYLINNADFEAVLPLRRYEFTSISSYMIKSLVIFHHYECHSSTEELAGCVLDIIRDFVNAEKTQETKLLTAQLRFEWSYQMEYSDSIIRFSMKALLQKLRKLNRSNGLYTYRKPRSVAESVWRYHHGELSCTDKLKMFCSCV